MRVNRYKLMVISFAATAFLSFAELTVKLEPEEVSRFAYEPFSLLLETSKDATLPDVPNGSGYSITGIVREPDSGTFHIEVIAEETGTLSLPPFPVIAGEESIQTPLLRLAVGAPRPANEMELFFQLSATNLVVGQPARMNVTWKSRVPFTRCQELQFALPLLRNPALEVYPLDPDVPEKERIGLPVNAQRMIAHNAQTEAGYELSFSYQLIPRSEGIYPVEAQMSCVLMEARTSSSQYPSYFDNHFFNRPDRRDRYERVYLQTAGPQLTVQSLPAQGRTVRYSGIVGDCAAAASIEPTDAVVGQPMLLTITLTNLAFGGHIHNLPEAALDGIGPEFLVTRDPMHIQTLKNAKAFTYIVRPLRSELAVLPALTFDIFDPDTKTYRTVRTAPLPITVAPDGEQTIHTPSRKMDPLIPQTGIRNNRKESEPAMYKLLELLAAHGWFFWAAPPLLWLALRPWLRRRDRGRTDPAYARALNALRRFNRAIKVDEETAWKTYLADRFDLAAEAVTFDAVKPHLEPIDPEILQEIHARFSAEEAERYAPPGTPKQRAAAACKLVGRIEKAIPVEAGRNRRVRCGQLGGLSLPVILLCLLPVFENDAAPADDRFEQAMDIRAERPDEAAPLFTEAALEFEAEERFFNAGNSWFFAGENGRALANYRAAERRRPRDNQIREGIEFIRTQRADSFQGLEKNSLAVSNVWKRLCIWSPALRIGLLTLLYLVAWAAFLSARTFGKTINRRAWIIYDCLAAAIALSLIWSVFQPSDGVVIQSTEARLGPGYAYETAYEGILHEAVEFQWLEERDGWVRARLPDDSEAWLRGTACVKIR